MTLCIVLLGRELIGEGWMMADQGPPV